MKIEVTICLGSSCFSRKNREVVAALQDYLKSNYLSNKVLLKGGHCFGKCKQGPVMCISGNIYTEIDPNKAIELMKKAIEENKSNI